jgi:hypothetical protein
VSDEPTTTEEEEPVDEPDEEPEVPQPDDE